MPVRRSDVAATRRGDRLGGIGGDDRGAERRRGERRRRPRLRHSRRPYANPSDCQQPIASFGPTRPPAGTTASRGTTASHRTTASRRDKRCAVRTCSWPHGRTQMSSNPSRSCERLVGFVPRPQRHLVRYAGVFGAANKHARSSAPGPATTPTTSVIFGLPKHGATHGIQRSTTDRGGTIQRLTGQKDLQGGVIHGVFRPLRRMSHLSRLASTTCRSGWGSHLSCWRRSERQVGSGRSVESSSFRGRQRDM
jgi:hypothetical protein